MMLLMLIPVVNIILLLVWALGGSKNLNRQAYARAALIMMLIGAVLSAVVGFFIGELFQSLLSQIPRL
jgi:dolichol kinase